MKERPILFNGEMVCAILDGRKTQTRRAVKLWEPDYSISAPKALPADFSMLPDGTSFRATCPYGQPGDRLWLREKCSAEELPNGDDGVRYLADGAWLPIENTREAADRWIALNAYRGKKGATVPSIHMPRWASRITLEITDVRVERLREITCGDLVAEGAPHNNIPLNLRWFKDVWASTGGEWEANPWVWVIEFKRIGAADREG